MILGVDILVKVIIWLIYGCRKDKFFGFSFIEHSNFGCINVFNENFYKTHKDALDRFERLSNKLVDTNLDITGQYIDYAFEFKYVTSGSKSFVEEVNLMFSSLKKPMK